MIHYHIGDATYPVGDGPKLIVHVCNDRGGWGKGFVRAVSKRWPDPERDYLRWHKTGYDTFSGPFRLGAIQPVLVQYQPRVWVVNMIAQAGYGIGNNNQHRSDEPDDTPPLRYEALAECLYAVSWILVGTPVHMPRIGCGLAGGTWDKVAPIIQRQLSNVQVHVYDLPQEA